MYPYLTYPMAAPPFPAPDIYYSIKVGDTDILTIYKLH